MHREAQAIHTIFGAGQVGTKLAHELLDRGHLVRIVRRGSPGAARAGLSWMSGDLLDPKFADEAARGAVAVYNCVNPPDYSRWHGVLEPMMRAVRGAATRAKARLVALDCLYMYGAPDSSPFDEETPMRPCSDKGELRAMLVDEMFEAHRKGEVEVTTGRAADYFGPGTPKSMLLHPRAVTRLLAGKSVEVFGDPDMPHGYAYTGDVARALAVLGTHPAAAGRAFHLPAAWTGTSRALLERCGTLVGREVKVTVVPKWALSAIGMFWAEGRAIRKMLYQWDRPYVLDDRRFRETFGWEPTPIDDALRATLGIAAPARAA